MRILLMGPPGAGKGTQAKRLAEIFDMVHLSSGDILRAQRDGDTALHRQLKSHMDAGELVPDALVVEIMAGAIASQPAGKGLLLDGFPRTVPQAEALDGQLESLSRPLDGVLVIEVPESVLVERITGRRSCPACGKVYHLRTLPPPPDGRCGSCGRALVQRSDDTVEVVRERLAGYRRWTEPVIAYYRRRGLRVMVVPGDAPPQEVTEQAVRVLRRRSLVGAGGSPGGD